MTAPDIVGYLCLFSIAALAVVFWIFNNAYERGNLELMIKMWSAAVFIAEAIMPGVITGSIIYYMWFAN